MTYTIYKVQSLVAQLLIIAKCKPVHQHLSHSVYIYVCVCDSVTLKNAIIFLLEHKPQVCKRMCSVMSTEKNIYSMFNKLNKGKNAQIKGAVES